MNYDELPAQVNFKSLKANLQCTEINRTQPLGKKSGINVKYTQFVGYGLKHAKSLVPHCVCNEKGAS